MKKIEFIAPFQAVVQEVEKPHCRPGEVLLRVRRIGVCGSDMQVFSGKNKYMQFPITPFHEGIAEVEETGSPDSKFVPGMQVAVLPIISCGKCYACKKGHENACMDFNCLGIQSDGLGAEYYVAQEKYLYEIPKELEWDKAILIEPLSVGMHAAARGDVEEKDVLIIGGGTIGNLTAQACKILGARKVCICDISQDKIELAKKSGIDGINTSDKTVKEAADIVFGGFPDVIMDCAGAGALLPQILELAGKTTTVVIVANHSAPVELDVTKIQRNELDIRGSIASDERDFRRAIQAMAEGKVYVEGFITGRFRADQIQEMMQQAVRNKGCNMKTIMEW